METPRPCGQRSSPAFSLPDRVDLNEETSSSSAAPMAVDPESFQDRRRRFDQQEAIWTRKKARTDVECLLRVGTTTWL